MKSEVEIKDKRIVCPESTIDSARRRKFLKKAVLAAAGTGAGATLLGKNVIPESAAKSNNCIFDCTIGTEVCWFIDSNETNSGILTPGLTFGVPCQTGEGIASDRAVACFLCYHGLNFYTDHTSKMVIRNCGKVGMGCVVCRELQATLTVDGQIYASEGIKGVCNSDGAHAGVVGTAKSCVAVFGCSVFGPGVIAQSCSGQAIVAKSSQPVVGAFQNNATAGDLSGGIQFVGSLACDAPFSWGAGVAGLCNSFGIPNGDFFICQSGVQRLVIDDCGDTIPDAAGTNRGDLYPGASIVFGCPKSGEGISSNRFTCAPNQYGLDFYTSSPPCHSNSPRMSIANCGNVGIGTRTPGMSLQVAGSFAAKVTTVTSKYSMGASDFGILANATSGAFAVTLPPANSAGGMLVFVKKIDSTGNAVTVDASGTNKIEGKKSDALKDQYESLALISDGSANWYEISFEKDPKKKLPGNKSIVRTHSLRR
jgi:hypothetical protein